MPARVQPVKIRVSVLIVLKCRLHMGLNFLGGEMLNKMSNAMVAIRVAAPKQLDLQLSGLCLLVFCVVLQTCLSNPHW